MPDELDCNKLSKREAEVLGLAMEGLTDRQIALRLEIQTSTVNSYWVRIRGKLGFLSRTELVSHVLRQQARQEAKDVEEARRISPEKRREQLIGPILEAVPHALVAVDGNLKIILTNARAIRLFGYSETEMAQKTLAELLASDQGDPIAESICDSTEAIPANGRSFRARRIDGTLIRGLIDVGTALSPVNGEVWTLLFRDIEDTDDNGKGLGWATQLAPQLM